MASPDGVRAWQAAIQVAIRVRTLVGSFPARGYGDLRDQMTRSAESIANNIAEGRGSEFPLEFIRFLDMAARSANELASQLTTAMGYGIVPQREAYNLRGTVICVRRMIESLRGIVRAQQTPPPTDRALTIRAYSGLYHAPSLRALAPRPRSAPLPLTL